MVYTVGNMARRPCGHWPDCAFLFENEVKALLEKDISDEARV